MDIQHKLIQDLELFPAMQDSRAIVGNTDYVDLVDDSQITVAGEALPIVSFTDPYRRKGAAFRVKVFCTQSGQEVDRGIFSLFQRYTDSPGFYVLCRSHRVAFPYNPRHRDGKFNVILKANTAMGRESYEIFSDILLSHQSSQGYVTKDGQYKIYLVNDFSFIPSLKTTINPSTLFLLFLCFVGYCDSVVTTQYFGDKVSDQNKKRKLHVIHQHFQKTHSVVALVDDDKEPKMPADAACHR